MANGHGGKRENAGKPKGRKNSKTLEFEAHCQDALQKAKVRDGELSAVEFFRSIYRDDRLPYSIRSHAADKALPYESPRLAATTLSGPNGGPIEARLTDARAELHRKLSRQESAATG
jgi:hypothetical protein